MRTTITLDDQLYSRLEALARRSHRSVKDMLNDTLKIGLSFSGVKGEDQVPFTVSVVNSSLQAGIDQGHLNSCLDDLDSAAFTPEESNR
jgi:hypothetical protein